MSNVIPIDNIIERWHAVAAKRQPRHEIIADRRIANPLLQALYQYWEQRRGEREMPRRADIDPGDIRRVLRNVVLIDVLDDQMRLRCRVAGTAISEITGLELTGKFFDDALPRCPYNDYLVNLVRETVAARRPVYSEGEIRVRGEAPGRHISSLMCPLSEDGTHVDKVIGAQVANLNSQASGLEVSHFVLVQENARVVS